jgi:hypothetical protein
MAEGLTNPVREVGKIPDDSCTLQLSFPPLFIHISLQMSNPSRKVTKMIIKQLDNSLTLQRKKEILTLKGAESGFYSSSLSSHFHVSSDDCRDVDEVLKDMFPDATFSGSHAKGARNYFGKDPQRFGGKPFLRTLRLHIVTTL